MQKKKVALWAAGRAEWATCQSAFGGWPAPEGVGGFGRAPAWSDAANHIVADDIDARGAAARALGLGGALPSGEGGGGGGDPPHRLPNRLLSPARVPPGSFPQLAGPQWALLESLESLDARWAACRRDRRKA